ncbi:MAG: YHS domain protein [Magnetovibrio sp.]|nr:YHS domain protein [Magnetovibrio sp.]
MFYGLRLFLIAVVGMAIVMASPSHAAKDKIYTGIFSNVALSGYDPVAYFPQGRAMKGQDQFSFAWNGATWRFVSTENRTDFQASPEKFAPQYGGYCAWAVSQGSTASTDPEAWHIRDGKLYLNYSKNVQSQWKQDIPGNITKGDANWPGVLGR